MTHVAPTSATSRMGSIVSRRDRPLGVDQQTIALTITSMQAGINDMSTAATGRPSAFQNVSISVGPTTKCVDAITPNSTNATVPAKNTAGRDPPKPAISATSQVTAITTAMTA